MQFIKEDIHTVRYQIDIPQNAIDILKKEYENDVRKGNSYYDTWEECLYEFLNELYEDPFAFKYNGYCENYGIKIDTFEDWDINDNDINIENIVNKIIKSKKVPE